MLQKSDIQNTSQSITEEELRKAVRRLTPSERRQQMISWIMSTLPRDSTTTREEVVEFLDKNPW